MMSILLVILLFNLIIIIVDGTHFLGGAITWHPLNASATGTPVAIVITQTYSWTYSKITCTTAMIATSQLIPDVGYTYLATDTLDCITSCGTGSIGYTAPSIRPYCTDISASVGTTVGQRSDIVYLKSGDDFSAAFRNNAWRSLATATNADWSISTHIIVKPRADNGLYNNAPVATMMSPINIPVNQPTIINVPVGDADGDPTRCRWSTASNGVDECGGVCPPSSLPSGTVIYPNCTIVINGQHVGDWFAITLMVEDFVSTSSTTPLSSVPVQFLIQVVGPPSCPTPPEIIGLPLEQSCTSVIVGQTFTSQLIAVNHCGPSVIIVDISTLSFSGMVQASISKLNTTEYYKTLLWTPTTSQLGYQVMCAMAFDSQNSQSAQYCFKFYVSIYDICVCPGEICRTTSTTTTSTTSTSTTATTTTTTTTSSTTSTTATTTTATTSTTTTTTSSTSTTSTSTTSTTATTSTTSTTTSTSTSTSSTSTTSTTSSSTSSSTSTSATSTTSTTTTSTTSTTSTSTTSTSTTSTTAITSIENLFEPTQWLIIGIIAGLTSLCSTTLCCYVCWRYCCRLSNRVSVYKRKKTVQFYHIERCLDPECGRYYMPCSDNIFSGPLKNYHVCDVTDY